MALQPRWINMDTVSAPFDILSVWVIGGNCVDSWLFLVTRDFYSFASNDASFTRHSSIAITCIPDSEQYPSITSIVIWRLQSINGILGQNMASYRPRLKNCMHDKNEAGTAVYRGSVARFWYVIGSVNIALYVRMGIITVTRRQQHAILRQMAYGEWSFYTIRTSLTLTMTKTLLKCSHYVV